MYRVFQTFISFPSQILLNPKLYSFSLQTYSFTLFSCSHLNISPAFSSHFRPLTWFLRLTLLSFSFALILTYFLVSLQTFFTLTMFLLLTIFYGCFVLFFPFSSQFLLFIFQLIFVLSFVLWIDNIFMHFFLSYDS